MNLQGFFIQWLESTGAPEFKMDYTVFRTQKGFRIIGKVAQDLDTFRMPVELKIETEGNPEDKRIDVSGPSTEFVAETFGKPRKVVIDPNQRLLRLNPNMRLSVAIRRGEQFAEVGDYNEALREYQKALEVNRISSLGHYRVAEIFFLQGNYQTAANEFREALNGDLEPEWTKVWSHINLGKIYDVTQQRDRAVNEYRQAVRTKDNTQGAQRKRPSTSRRPTSASPPIKPRKEPHLPTASPPHHRRGGSQYDWTFVRLESESGLTGMGERLEKGAIPLHGSFTRWADHQDACALQCPRSVRSG